jgi:hypothetical protein
MATQKKEKSMLGVLMRELLRTAGPIISSTLTAAVAGMQAQPQPVEGDGAQAATNTAYDANRTESPGTT